MQMSIRPKPRINMAAAEKSGLKDIPKGYEF
jgi:hypothetical protein